MPLLEVNNLTMRFGGLVAINNVSFQVEPGQIFAIIGPNGAGKTTVFNVVTGIYEPTKGTIKLAGREEGLPLTPRVIVRFVVIALLTALAFFLLSVNVNGLWKVAIRKNMTDPVNRPFTYARAWEDGLAYVRGGLFLEPGRLGRWSVVTADEQKTLGLIRGTEQEARALRDNLEKIIALRGSDATLEQRGDKWVILAADRQEVLGEYDTQDWARYRLRELAEVADNRQGLPWLYAGALILGLLLGSLGSFAIWNRSRRTAEVIALAGIARTFQNIRLFPNMTVVENVLVAMDRRFGSGWWSALKALVGLRREETEAANEACQLLDFVGLRGKGNQLARSLPYGEQRRLEIARALATRPKLLLLDEPAAGMNPSEGDDLVALIARIRRRGITVLLIEHHMTVVMAISDRIAVLDYGVKIAEGTPAEVRSNPAVIEAYLGKEEDAA